MKKKIVAALIAVPLLAALIVISFPYLKAEYLTAKYGSQFEDEYVQTHMLDYADYCKVLDCDGSYARVVYIEKGVCTNTLEFEYRGGDWVMTRWDTIWSSSGSADSLMWPLYF